MIISNVEDLKWNATYDVLVLGFGGAGATAARFAADNGSKVLLVDSAPSGHEGGNTRYSGQLIGSTDNPVEYKKYYQAQVYPLHLDEKTLDTFVDGVANMKDYFRKYLDVEPFVFKDHPDDPAVQSVANDNPDYPHYPGSDSYTMLTVHQGKTISDGAFWTILREKVLERSDKIDVWYESPAVRLIQDAKTNAIVGAQIKRQGNVLNVYAKNGVVLTTGGFENNKNAIQNYTGNPTLVPMGTLYNKGDSIRLATDVGADIWHTNAYNAAGMFHGLTYKVDDGKRGILSATWPDLYSGSIFIVATDGSRYFKEDEAAKEGYMSINGSWSHPLFPTKSYLVFDEKQYQKLLKINDPALQNALKDVVSATNSEELADKINAKPEVLAETLQNFNRFANEKHDYEFNRDPDTLQAFDENKLYAITLLPVVLNTQGGPKRNYKAEIVNTLGNPIPHLYGAGEAGSITTNRYQAGQDLAECLIFGKIAGEAASVEKDIDSEVQQLDGVSGASQDVNLMKSDITTQENYHTDDNQFIGHSSAGMGDEIVVRVTVDDDDNIQKVEVLKQSESEDIGLKAINELPKQMEQKHSVDVDSVSGASTTSNALKQAVKDALSKVTDQ